MSLQEFMLAPLKIESEYQNWDINKPMPEDDRSNSNYMSWEELLKRECLLNDDDYSKIICTLSKNKRAKKFNTGFGLIEGERFSAWTDDYVYFPEVYDGLESVASVPRNPCDKVTRHVGGGGANCSDEI